MKTLKLIVLVIGIFGANQELLAQENPHLHLSPEWEECSFQLDPSLTQDFWKKFTREAGLVITQRPMISAEPLGVGKIDLSIHKWSTAIDEGDAAWNNTFVHPDSTHWLIDGPRLTIPGLTLRTGITKKMDIGIYWTTNPWANYSIAGAQLQYSFLNDTTKGWAAASRLSFTTIYGPRDLTFANYGLDFTGSKKFNLYKNWISFTPYTNLNFSLSHAHERTDAVSLSDEFIFTPQVAAGGVLALSVVRLGVEYNFSATSTFSYRVGIVLNFKGMKK